MPDWTASMQQTYEYYKVDPGTWADLEKITDVTASNIVRDADNDTRGSASFDVTSDLGELYIRTYLVTTQKRRTERTVLGTHLAQTTNESHDGKYQKVSLDAYTPLLELKEKNPPIGYAIAAGVNILEVATRLVAENVRAPVVGGTSDKTLPQAFVSDIQDTWFTFITDLLACASYSLDVDEMGQILFTPAQDANSLRAIWTYDDSNSSILQPEIDKSRDLYGIPNVLEVLYTRDDGRHIFAKAVNDDPDSPISTVNRGRTVVQRITDPELYGVPTQDMLDRYARQKLRDLSTLEYTLTYTHGYCPVRVGDCVLLNYKRAGLVNRRAKVTRQSIKCETGCQVEETAVYTTSLWG